MFWRIIVGALIGAQLIISAVATFRIRETYMLREDLNLLRIEYRGLKDSFTSFVEEETSRREEVEKVLFGEVLSKIDKKPPPNRLEKWMSNRDADMRRRLERLERWRLDTEKR